MAMVRAVLYEYSCKDITPGYAVVVESMYSCILRRLTVQQLQKLQNY